MSYEPTNFRTTVIKLYHQDKTTNVSQTASSAITNNNSESDYNLTANITVPLTLMKRRERSKKFKNKLKVTSIIDKVFPMIKKKHDHRLSLTL